MMWVIWLWVCGLRADAALGTLLQQRAVVEVLSIRSAGAAEAFAFDAAIADLDLAIAAAAAFPERLPALYVERGQRILLLYEWDRVLADYNRALELDPTYTPALYYRGVLFYSTGRREAALADFSAYLAAAPGGSHAADAQRYADNIRTELAALEG